MANDPTPQPRRSDADKERSRQQSRQVSGKEAARTTGGRNQGRPGSPGQRPQRGQGQGQRPGGPGQRPQKGQRSSGRQGPPSRTGARRPGQRPAARPGPSRSNLYTWGVVGLVVVIVGIFLAIHFTSSTTKTTVKPGPVPTKVLSAVTKVPSSVFDKVGTGAAVTISVPKVESGTTTLTVTGKPGVVFLGGEFCPYCAAERWSIIAALSRFGTFSGLLTMSSASTDIYPSTATFTFVHSKYTSQYINVKLVEAYSNVRLSTGGHALLETVTKLVKNVVKKYDVGTTATSSGSIPFFDIGNKLISSGAAFSPGLIQGLTRTQIAADLSDPTNPVTQAIIGTANYISAGICDIDGSQPADVCTSAGVKAATSSLKLTG